MLISYTLFFLTLLNLQAKDCYRWGTYKPHLLYHYLQQGGSSFGLMYAKPSLNIPLHFKYSNQDFYSTYLLQDFQGTIHSTVKDSKADLELDIKTLYDCEEYWQTHIKLSQGFQFPLSSHRKGHSTELVLYFYNQLPDEQILVEQSKDGWIVNFTKSFQTFKVKIVNDQNDMISHQTLNYLQDNLWKTDLIYNKKTFKTYDLYSGCNLLSEQKKQTEFSFKQSFKDAMSLKNQRKDFYTQNINGSSLANHFIFNALKICSTLQQYNHFDEPPQVVAQKLKDNIAFLQLITAHNQQSIIIEHSGRNNSNKIQDFLQEFTRKQQIFEQNVFTKFYPQDFTFINQRLIQKQQAQGIPSGFSPPHYDLKNTTFEFIQCLQQTVSNILGGIVFYTGEIIRSDEIDDKEKNVFSASPSRSVFPRGFLWDDGFHLIPICKWDEELCKKIIMNWMDLMDDEGWIAREQARGEEINSQIPSRFISQDPKEANPPTLLLPLRMIMGQIARVIKQVHELMDKLKKNTFENPDEEHEIKFRIKEHQQYLIRETNFLKLVYPKLKLWKAWFMKTQSHYNEDDPSNIKLRWRCKDGCDDGLLFLGSGMDDYPRQKHGATLQEHLDLKCWLMLFDNTFSQIELILAEISPNKSEKDFHFLSANQFFESYGQLIADLHQNFKDQEDYLFKDYANKHEYVNVVDENYSYSGGSQSKQGYSDLYDEMYYAEYSDENDPSGEYEVQEESTFIYEPGYVNLFPMFFGSLNSNSFEWKAIIKLITDKNNLWSDYGVRSLSKKSNYYGTNEDYWRGAIWMPINYLILRSIRLYSQDEDSKKLYYKLRENLIVNIYKNWQETGFMFENYNGDTGTGQRGFPFDGWTGATFLAICSETFE